PCRCGCPGDAAVTPECCPRHRGLALLRVTVAGGQGWRGDHLSMTDGYVKVIFGGHQARTATVWNNNRPHWGALLPLGMVALTPGARLRVEVWDEDNGWDDDLLGACEEPMVAGGNREVVCFPGGGRLSFSYQAACGPSLGGPICHDYVPQAPEGDGQLYRSSRWPPG
ncbi:PERF protein, partial [Nyctibius bracteatus]|nr:PERF protein [Nyctibius bracteatus]